MYCFFLEAPMIEWFLKRKYFYPNQYVKTIFDIDFARLKDQGIQYLLVDLDNTLIPYDETIANERIKNLFESLNNHGFKVLIISNNKEERVKIFSEDLDVQYIYSAKKPLKTGFKKAMRILGYPSHSEVALIGDQFMTDVYGGNRMGFYTIVVDAIKRKSEKWYTKFNRRLEQRVLKRLKRTDPSYYQKLKLEEKR